MRSKGLEEQEEVECSGSTEGPWGQAKEGHQNPVCEDLGLDPGGRGGDCILALCRGVTSDLCFKKIILACIFYD